MLAFRVHSHDWKAASIARLQFCRLNCLFLSHHFYINSAKTLLEQNVCHQHGEAQGEGREGEKRTSALLIAL